jgi:hypothetical protein
MATGTVAVVMDVDEAAEIAGTKLGEALPRRWRHVDLDAGR